MKSWLKKAAGIAFTDGKSLLLMKRAGKGENVGTWAFPGGKAKEGESEIGNAIRETKEETGLTSIPGNRFDSIVTKSKTKKFTVFFYHVNKPFEIQLNHEHSDYEWVEFENLKNKKLHPKIELNIDSYLSKIKRNIKSFSEWCCIKKAETDLNRIHNSI